MINKYSDDCDSNESKVRRAISLRKIDLDYWAASIVSLKAVAHFCCLQGICVAFDRSVDRESSHWNISTDSYARMHKVYGEGCMRHSQMCKWFRCFQDGLKDVDIDECLGRSTTSRIVKPIADVRVDLKGHRWITIRELSEDGKIIYGSVLPVITEDLDMRQVPANFESILLTAGQNVIRVCTRVVQDLDSIENGEKPC